MHAWIFHHSESLGEWKYKPKYNEDQDSHANIFILLRVTRSQAYVTFSVFYIFVQILFDECQKDFITNMFVSDESMRKPQFVPTTMDAIEFTKKVK